MFPLTKFCHGTECAVWMELDFPGVLTGFDSNAHKAEDFVGIREKMGIISGLFSLSPFTKCIIPGELI